MPAVRLGRCDVGTFALRRVSVVPLKCPGLGGWEKKEGTLQRASHLDIPLNVIPQLVLIKHDSLKLGRSVGPTVSCMINGCSCGLLFIYREINSNMGEKSAFSIHRGTSLYLFSINKYIDHSPYRN